MRLYSSIASQLSVVFRITENKKKTSYRATRPFVIWHIVAGETPLQPLPLYIAISLNFFHLLTRVSCAQSASDCCWEGTFPTFYVTSSFSPLRAHSKCQPSPIALTRRPRTGHLRLCTIQNFVFFFIAVLTLGNDFCSPLTCLLPGCTHEIEDS